jgi:2-phospho-L-lactate/phosphoenolpyruvate guanylyltransferase
MTAILIPVKKLQGAKQRLAAHFAAEARRALADALWQDFFEVIAEVRGAQRIVVVSAEPAVLQRARSLGWETIAESEQISESVSVDAASRQCVEMGLRSLLRLPADLPLLEPRDVEAILEHAQDCASAVIVPSRDGDGTNALLRTPPTLFPSRFGAGSFAKHLAEAQRAGVRATVLRNARIAMDIDELGDLEALNGQALRGQRTQAWLERNFNRRRSSSPAL